MNQQYVTWTNIQITKAIAGHPIACELYIKGMEMATTDEEKAAVVTMCMMMVPETVAMLAKVIYAQARGEIVA